MKFDSGKLVLDKRHESANEGDDSTYEDEPESDRKTGVSILGEEHEVEDNGNQCNNENNESEDVVDLLESLIVDECGDDQRHECDDSCYQRHERHIAIVKTAVGEDIPTGPVQCCNVNVETSPVKEYSDGHQNRSEDTDESQKIDILRVHF